MHPLASSIAPLGWNEPERLRALQGLRLDEMVPDAYLQTLVENVAKSLSVAVVLISVVDKDRQFFLAEVGLGVAETHRDCSVCAFVVHQAAFLVIPDSRADARIIDNPLFADEDGFRFYAGTPLRVCGCLIGTLCVLDRQPHLHFGEAEQSLLQTDADKAKARLEEIIRARRGGDQPPA